MTAGHNADVLDLPTPSWVEELYAQHDMPPSTTTGASTCFSDFVDSVGKTLTPPIEAMAEILCTAVTEHGVKLDRCIKKSLWQSMFEGFARTTDWDNRRIATVLNGAFTTNCMGDHWRATQSVNASTRWFETELNKLQLLSNGPATLLMADPSEFPGDLIARINAVQQRISSCWAAKFADDRDIDAQTQGRQDPEDDFQEDSDGDDNYWDQLTEEQAALQKAAGYRRTARLVARLIADSILEAQEAGHEPLAYVSAWLRLNALTTNRFGRPRNGHRQPPKPLNTTSLFRAVSLLSYSHPEMTRRVTKGFAEQWPGHGPTALVRLADPGCILPGERAEIRLNPQTGDYLLCRNGKEPLCKVLSGGSHFQSLPLTYAGSPEPLDPTGQTEEAQDLHLFLVHSTQPQTVIVMPNDDDETDFAHDEETHIVREATPRGPAYYLATTQGYLQQQLKAGRQAVLHKALLNGVHERHMGRNFRYAGISHSGGFLLRCEHRSTSKSEKLIDDLVAMLLAA